MLKERINKTHEYLDGHFVTSEGNLDLGYLLDSIRFWVDNTEELINAVSENRRRPIRGIVWAGLIGLCDQELKFDGYKASSYHLKKWFEKYGLDYKVAIAPLVSQYEEERENAIKEREGK